MTKRSKNRYLDNKPFEDEHGHYWFRRTPKSSTSGIVTIITHYNWKCERCGITMENQKSEKQCPKGPTQVTYSFYDEHSIIGIRPVKKKKRKQ